MTTTEDNEDQEALGVVRAALTELSDDANDAYRKDLQAERILSALAAEGYTVAHSHNEWTCYAHVSGDDPCSCTDLEGTACNPYFNEAQCPEHGIYDRPPSCSLNVEFEYGLRLDNGVTSCVRRARFARFYSGIQTGASVVRRVVGPWEPVPEGSADAKWWDDGALGIAVQQHTHPDDAYAQRIQAEGSANHADGFVGASDHCCFAGCTPCQRCGECVNGPHFCKGSAKERGDLNG